MLSTCRASNASKLALAASCSCSRSHILATERSALLPFLFPTSWYVQSRSASSASKQSEGKLRQKKQRMYKLKREKEAEIQINEYRKLVAEVQKEEKVQQIQQLELAAFAESIILSASSSSRQQRGLLHSSFDSTTALPHPSTESDVTSTSLSLSEQSTTLSIPISSIPRSILSRLENSLHLALSNPSILNHPFALHELTLISDSLSQPSQSGLTPRHMASLIYAHAVLRNPQAAQHAFDLVPHIPMQPTLPIFNSLLHAHSLSRNLSATARTFRLLRSTTTSPPLTPDVASYGCLIRACSDSGKLSAAFALYDQMKRHGVHPDLHTFTTLVSACVRANEHERAWRTFDHARTEAGIKPDTHMYTSLISSCAKTGSAERALDLFTEMTDDRALVPTLATYNALLRSLASNRNLRPHIPALVSRMHLSNIAPDSRTYDALIICAGRAGDLLAAREYWNACVAAGEADGVVLGNLVRAYGYAVGDWYKDVEKRRKEREMDFQEWYSRRGRAGDQVGQGERNDNVGGTHANARAHSLHLVTCLFTSKEELDDPPFAAWIQSKYAQGTAEISVARPLPVAPDQRGATESGSRDDWEDEDDGLETDGQFVDVSGDGTTDGKNGSDLKDAEDLIASWRNVGGKVQVEEGEVDEGLGTDMDSCGKAESVRDGQIGVSNLGISELQANRLASSASTSPIDRDHPYPTPRLTFLSQAADSTSSFPTTDIVFPTLLSPILSHHDAIVEAQAVFEWALDQHERAVGLVGVGEVVQREDLIEEGRIMQEADDWLEEDMDGREVGEAEVGIQDLVGAAERKDGKRSIRNVADRVSKEYLGPTDEDITENAIGVVSVSSKISPTRPALPPLEPPPLPTPPTTPLLSRFTLNAYLVLHHRHPSTLPNVPTMSAKLHARLGLSPDPPTRFLVLDAVVNDAGLMRDTGKSVWEDLILWDDQEEHAMGNVDEGARERMRNRDGRGREAWGQAWCKVVNGWARIGDHESALSALESLQAFRRPFYLETPRLHYLTPLHRLCRDLDEDGNPAPLRRLLRLADHGPRDALEEVQRHLRRNWVGAGWWGWEAIGVGKRDLKEMERRATGTKVDWGPRNRKQTEWGSIAQKANGWR
ncbi:hypothetical protein HDU93_005172 [Gonapodya sp. JEL0774]|nr:hypothetical protein HDU93_005172 [Gonapodya sp. JEL0774]